VSKKIVLEDEKSDRGAFLLPSDDKQSG